MVAFTKLITVGALVTLGTAPPGVEASHRLRIWFRRYLDGMKCKPSTSIGRKPWGTNDGGADKLKAGWCKDWARAPAFTNYAYSKVNRGDEPDLDCRVIVYEGHHCTGRQYSMGNYYQGEGMCGGDMGFAAHSVFVVCLNESTSYEQPWVVEPSRTYPAYASAPTPADEIQDTHDWSPEDTRDW